MTGLRSIAIKFIAFAVVSGFLGFLLVNTMLNGVSGDKQEFTADFSDVNGLRVGDDVKAAGVRVGRVTSISATDAGAVVQLDLLKQQPLYDNTHVIMRYQNLLGQRYVSLVQNARPGNELPAGATIPESRTSPGFDLTELLNGFRPLFRILQPQDVNKLATSMIKVLQGEGPSIEVLLQQTGHLTNFIADRDTVINAVMTNLKPVLDNLAGQGGQLKSTIKELEALMTGLAKDRRSIGASIDGVSKLVGSTSSLLRNVKVPLVGATNQFVSVASMLNSSRATLEKTVPAFSTVFESLGRATSYENALNVYVCKLSLGVGSTTEIPVGGNNFSAVCR
ncbi:MAG: MCE family protein [Nocardioidaceae bacterium]|nr:MCE family protein [Nocardioidaceae bacterium]MCL2611791.1 MCE family protein [Nocardioidaceae bacterium]